MYQTQLMNWRSFPNNYFVRKKYSELAILALGKRLKIQLASENKTFVSLEDLAMPFAQSIIEQRRQANVRQSLLHPNFFMVANYTLKTKLTTTGGN